MSHIKHQMIERRDIDLLISKKELVTKILESYDIKKPSDDLIAKLQVSWTDGRLKICGVEETLITEITPEFNDNVIEATQKTKIKSIEKSFYRTVDVDLKSIKHVLSPETIYGHPQIMSLTFDQAAQLGCAHTKLNPGTFYGVGGTSSSFFPKVIASLTFTQGGFLPYEDGYAFATNSYDFENGIRLDNHFGFSKDGSCWSILKQSNTGPLQVSSGLNYTFEKMLNHFGFSRVR